MMGTKASMVGKGRYLCMGRTLPNGDFLGYESRQTVTR